MCKHLVVTGDLNHLSIRYFVEYQDTGEVCMTIWTTDFWKAKWFDAEDAKIEAALLSGLCPNYQIEVQQVYGASKGRR